MGSHISGYRPGLFTCWIFIIFFLRGFDAMSQDRITEAKKEMELFNYSKAAGILQGPAMKGNDRSKREAALLLADCYRMMNDVPVAKTWYEKVLLNAKPGQEQDIPPVNRYNYAQVLRSCGQYAAARRAFLRYDSLVPGDRRGKQYAAFCDSALSWQSMEPRYRVTDLREVNSAQSDFGAVFYRDGILFTSDRLDGKEKAKIYGWTGNGYLNLYFAAPAGKDSTSLVFNPPRAAPEIAGMPWHDGPVSFSRDGTGVFITLTQATRDKGRKDGKGLSTHLLKIYTSTFTGGKWATPEPFFLNSDEYSVGHPALTPDGKRLYFVSDMQGGEGETDIWYCDRTDGKWGQPVNAGSMVNTAGKEMFPFVAGNGDLYFASDGHPGFGGLDLFVTRMEGGRWIRPENLGQPINSSYDDFSVAVGGSGDRGLFSSNRPGGAGSDDIYSFFSIEKKPVMVAIQPPVSPPVAVPPPPMNADTMELNKPYRLENIFYDFDKWNIRGDAKPPLDRLVELMKKYPVTIELGSHTDCRGTEEYNLALSQRRAESAVQYIISKGIEPGRITAKGYGKSQLANRCNCAAGVECTEAEHQYNRRTEFRITGR